MAEYVVKKGDTLSGIAHELMGDGTEKSWRKIYEANKSVIGADPNLIKPGQVLQVEVEDETEV